ncbi:hypothetical protein Golax_023096 [Gossypium laxum]|uniref:Uncharacterized protein n=1 Tax=Gossypium laxum TaxID=34288 RepID=A0A7J9B4V0_9ROSI|nr:hypothetical protein [Gossypium laxum]
MSVEEEYYINLYARGKFVRDPHLRYSGAIATVEGYSDGNQGGEGLNGKGVEVVGSKGAEVDAASQGLHGLDAFVEGFGDRNQGGEGGEGLNGEGVEVAGNKGGEGFEGLNGKGVEVVGSRGDKGFKGLNGEGVKVASSKGGEGGEGGEGFRGLNDEGVEVAGNKGGEVDVIGEALNGLDAFVEGLEQGDRGLNSGVEEADDEGLKMKVIVIQMMTRQKWREVEGKTSGKAKEKLVDKTESKSSRKEEEGNKTKYFDSDDHGSILGSNDYDKTDAYRRSRFPTYIPNSASPLFCIRMVFKDALKRSGKEGCSPILGLDGCLLKGPFKGEILSTVGRDGTN